MQISAIGSGSSAALQAWADMLASNQVGSSALDQLVSAANGDKTINGLRGMIASSGLTPSSQVNLSDAALTFGSTDSQGGDPSLGQIAQALMVVLILQLLDPGGGTA
jgi:hypothetical protein